MSNIRIFKIIINNKGSIIRTTVSVESPGGFVQAKQLAESMYGGPGITVSILA